MRTHHRAESKKTPLTGLTTNRLPRQPDWSESRCGWQGQAYTFHFTKPQPWSGVTGIAQSFSGAEVVTDYGYDEINRLTKETTCDYLNPYYYDDGGNRTKMIQKKAQYMRDGQNNITKVVKAGRKPRDGCKQGRQCGSNRNRYYVP